MTDLSPAHRDRPGDTSRSAHPPNEHPPRRRLRRILALAVLGYLGLCLALMVMESRMVFPGAYNDRRPEDRIEDGGRESVGGRRRVRGFFYADDSDSDDSRASSELRYARLCEVDDPRHVVLFFHGNGSHATSLDHWALRLSKVLGATVMVAEYRGYDGSDRTPTEASVVADGIAALDELCRRTQVPADQVVLYGRSLGGGIAAAVAAARGGKAVVMERTFDRLDAVAAARFPVVPVRRLIRNRFDSVTRLRAYPGPILQIHGTADRVIPVTHAEALRTEVGDDRVRSVIVPGLSHNGRISRPTLAKVKAFLAETASAEPSDAERAE